MILVQVNRIRAAKKLVLFFRFLETSARQISECRGQFEHLPESCQSASINIVFASEQLDIKDLRDFGARIKEYFKLSPAFYTQSASLILVEPELKKFCEVVKFQKASMKELAEYYLSYMDRQGKEADPKVRDKLSKNQYSDSIHPPVPPQPFGYGGPGGFGGPTGPGGFGGPTGPGGFGGYQQMPGFPPNPNGGYNPFAQPGQQPYQRPPPGGTPFGGNPVPGPGLYNPFSAAPQPQPYAMNAPQGYQLPQPNTYNLQQPQMPTPPGAGGFNPFSANQGTEYAKASPPHPFGPAPTGNGGNQFDDLFADPSEPKNHNFGGDKKQTADDDFLKQLEELKKL
jgi:hypothetical protein